MMTEHGYRVQPRSTTEVARRAEAFLRRFAPDHLESGAALDMASLVDHGLHEAGIFVYGVEDGDLPDAEAETRATAGPWIDILMRDEFYRALFELNSNTVRARSTLAHEIGHAILHEEEVRTGRHLPHLLALRRAPRRDLRPFEDSEWQAHTFAGALLIPRPVLRTVDHDITCLADRFTVSEPFVESHLRRIARAL